MPSAIRTRRAIAGAGAIRLWFVALLLPLLSSCLYDPYAGGSTPTNPTPGTGGTGGGEIATVQEGVPPGFGSGDIPADYQATNRGLYFQVEWRDDRPGSVVKLEGNPAQPGSWIVTTPHNVAGAIVDRFAPANTISEGAREVAYYWSSSSFPDPNRWGRYTQNSGGVSFSVRKDVNMRVVTGGAVNGTVAPRPWIVSFITGGTEGYAPSQDDGAYSNTNLASDYFSTYASPRFPEEPTIAVPHPRDPHLYIAAGSKLYVYSSDRQISASSFPSGALLQSFSDLVWNGEELFIGYGDKIYRRDINGRITEFTTLPLGVFSPGQSGRFCVTGGEVYLTNGTAINISTGQQRDWIARGSLSDSQQMAALVLRSSLTQIFCSPNATSPEIFAASFLGKISFLRIIPLPR